MTSGLLERASQAVARSRTASLLARLGLLSRAGFYLLLAYLVVRIALLTPGRQVNASGALRTVAAAPFGRVLVAAAAVGFLVFGLTRLLGALRDRDAGVVSRVSTGLQGAFYLCLSEVPVSFVLGNSSTGSEQSERSTTAHVLMLPAGRALVLTAGVVLVGVCLWQVVGALRTGFTESLEIGQLPAWARLLVRVLGRVGITLRALVFLPVGIYLVVSGAHSDPRQAKGLDASLAGLAHSGWGRLLLFVVAVGFLVFVAYTLVEARYRDVDAGS